MEMNELVRPYKQRLVVESLIRASVFGLFFGLCLTLLTAIIFRAFPMNWYSMHWGFIVASVGAGVVCATIVGIVIFITRYRYGIEAIARRMDRLGLEERVSTMVEYRRDKSYVAKLQRDDARAKIAELDTKAMKIKVPKKTLVACFAILVAILLLFTIYAKEKQSHIEAGKLFVETVEELLEDSDLSEEDKEAIKDIIDNYKDQLRDDMTKEEHDALIEETKDKLKDYLNQKKEIRETIIENLKENEITKDLADAIESEDPDKIKDAIEDLKEQIEKQPTEEQKKEMADKIQDAFEEAIKDT